MFASEITGVELREIYKRLNSEEQNVINNLVETNANLVKLCYTKDKESKEWRDLYFSISD